MKKRRAVLLFLGLVLMFSACWALTYALWPLGNTQIQWPLEPTLFAPPAP